MEDFAIRADDCAILSGMNPLFGQEDILGTEDFTVGTMYLAICSHEGTGNNLAVPVTNHPVFIHRDQIPGCDLFVVCCTESTICSEMKAILFFGEQTDRAIGCDMNSVCTQYRAVFGCDASIRAYGYSGKDMSVGGYHLAPAVFIEAAL